MKKKYLSLYFIDSAVTFIILILFLALSFLKNDTSVYNFVTYLGKYFLTSAFMVINTALFIVVINLLKKYNLEANSLVLPICYLVFTIIIVLVSLILNNYVVIKNMHFVYFYRFIVFDYLLLNAYTILSFKK